MKKQRVIIVHGWGGSPQNDWFPWAKKVLEEKGFEVIIPAMPNTNNPVIDAWVTHLEKTVGTVQNDDIFIGHSIGNQTIWRYFETLPENMSVEKMIFVAPWVTLSNLSEEEKIIAQPWIKTPIHFEKVAHKAQKFIALFSSNDPVVPLFENKKIIEEKLHTQCVVLHNKGHFTADEDVTEIPEILKYV